MLLLIFIHAIRSFKEELTPLLNDNSNLKSEGDEVYIECARLDIVLESDITKMECDSSPLTYITKKYIFRVNNLLTVKNESEYEIEKRIQKLNEETFVFSHETEIKFYRFWNITLVDSFINNFTFYNASIFPGWSEYGNTSGYCPWDSIEYKENYNFLDKYFENSLIDSNWRKVCIEDFGYMQYTENKKGEIIVVSMPTSIVLIIISILIIAAIIVSLYFIANIKISGKSPVDNSLSGN